MVEHPRTALRRLPPDPIQFQVILGSLLGDGRLIGQRRETCLQIAHGIQRREYIQWKYERLGPFAAGPPTDRGDGLLAFETVRHPLFDDLARLFADRFAKHDVIDRLLRPLGLAVWLSDVGRLDLRASAFLPAQRELALAG